MKRPTVILNVFSSIDGKITTAPSRNVLEWTAAGIDGAANELTHQLFDQLNCDALVSGSESLIVWGKDWVEIEQPIYEPKKSKAYKRKYISFCIIATKAITQRLGERQVF